MAMDIALFAARLAATRKEKKLSQQELGKRAGFDKRMISRYEKAEATPSVVAAAKIASALGLSLDWLCGLSDKQQKQSPLLAAAKACEKLPKEQQKAIINLLNALAK